MSESIAVPAHITDIEMARYLDHRLSPAERDRVEDHLAGCAQCRHLALGSQQVLRGVRRPRRILAAGGLAAAAAVLIVIGRVAPGIRDAPQERAASADNATLTVYGPTGDAKNENLRFVWGATANVESYRLSLTSADGAEVWSHSGLDTVAILPRTVTLRRGGNYFWVADAVLKDGSTRSTGLREFSLAP